MTATYLPSRNGVATSTSLLVQGLRALGHDVRVFAPEHPRRERTPEDGVYRMPSTLVGAPLDYPLMLPIGPVAAARLPLDDLDVLHTMHPFVTGLTALRWSRALDVPLVFTAHTQYHEYVHYARAPRRLGRALVARHVRAFAHAADLVLAPGTAMTDTLRHYGFRGDVSVLPNPIDTRALRDAQSANVRNQLGIPADVPVLVYVGRLAPEKNLDVLLGAFARVIRERPEARLVVVGDGPSRAALTVRAADLPVFFAGGVPYERVPAFLHAADAFVTASTSEVLPMSLLEALAAGLPLVAAHSPAARDIIRDGVNGTVCAAVPDDLAVGMLRALDAANHTAWRAGAVKSAGAFDVARVSEELSRLYVRAGRERLVRREGRFTAA